MNIWNLHPSINFEYFVDSAIHVVEDYHEEDNLSIGNGKDNNPVLKQNLSRMLCLCTIIRDFPHPYGNPLNSQGLFILRTVRRSEFSLNISNSFKRN